MSQKKEKYARKIGERVDKLEEAVGRLEWETPSLFNEKEGSRWERRLRYARRRTAEAEREAGMWRATAMAAVAALAVISLIYAMAPREEADNSQETADPLPVVQTIPLPEEDKPAERLNEIQDCTITYFCAEKYPHICGTGDGITATGKKAEPGVTCAVDPAVIPLGSTVLVDFGDGEIHTYRAEDIGGAVKGDHIDLCVDTHQEATALGVRQAAVYWEEAG